MSSLLTDELLENIGRSTQPRKELVTDRDIRKYSVATGQRLQKFLSGEVAPPLYHMALFWDVVELDELSPDGVSVDHLIPELPLNRAMAGGLKVEYFQPIKAGDTLTAVRTLTDIYEKHGRSGPLIFYEVIMTVVNESNEPVLTQKTTRIMR